MPDLVVRVHAPRQFYAIDDFGLKLALLERGSSRRIMVMRFRPANIRVIHRRCRSADQMTGSQNKKPVEMTAASMPWRIEVALTGQGVVLHVKLKVQLVPEQARFLRQPDRNVRNRLADAYLLSDRSVSQ